jgi:hypothetical protein
MLKEGIGLFPAGRRVTRGQFYRKIDRLVLAESETKQNRALIEAAYSHMTDLFETYRATCSYAKLMSQLYRAAYKRAVWGDKILRIEHARPIVRRLPNARFIILMRDPRAVLASQRSKWDFSVTMSAGYWLTHARLVEGLRADLPRQVLVARYEDLISDCRPVLESMLCFADPGSLVFLTDILRRHPPDQEAPHRWQSSLSKDDVTSVESLCGPEMRRWGYSATTSAEDRRLSRTRYAGELARRYLWTVRRPEVAHRKRLLARFHMMVGSMRAPRDS